MRVIIQKETETIVLENVTKVEEQMVGTGFEDGINVYQGKKKHHYDSYDLQSMTIE